MKKNIRRFLVLPLIATLCAPMMFAAKAKPKTEAAARAKSAIFGLIDDGTTLEPIAFVEDGKLVAAGSDGSADQSGFWATYYKIGTKYDLIFGGVPNGTVTIKKSNVGTDCGGSSADVTALSTKGKQKGFVMGLATNIAPTAKAAGTRRTPTAGERAEIDALVRAEYSKHKVPAAAYKQLHFHNLTAVDVNNDGTVELVGSYWVAPKASERGLLFFIAEKNASGKYALNYSSYETYTADKVMSGKLSDLEDGMDQTLLLDIFDYDGDGTSEIFTVSKAFEGNNYAVFRKTAGKWTRELDAYDYRCGY